MIAPSRKTRIHRMNANASGPAADPRGTASDQPPIQLLGYSPSSGAGTKPTPYSSPGAYLWR